MPESINIQTDQSEGSPIVVLQHNERALMYSFAIIIFALLYAIFCAFSVLWTDFKVAGMKSGVIRGWKNPEDAPKALEILKQHAFSFTSG